MYISLCIFNCVYCRSPAQEFLRPFSPFLIGEKFLSFVELCSESDFPIKLL